MYGSEKWKWCNVVISSNWIELLPQFVSVSISYRIQFLNDREGEMGDFPPYQKHSAGFERKSGHKPIRRINRMHFLLLSKE